MSISSVTICLLFVIGSYGTPIKPQNSTGDANLGVWEYPCASGSIAAKLAFCNTSLSFEDRAKDLIYNQLETSELINITGNTAYAIPRLGISAYQWWSEALHGVANSPGITYSGSIKYTTMFPQVIGTAASWNRTLWSKIGETVSTEARAMYNNQQAAGLTFWAPNVNIFRDPRWGRGQETPGEDPFINGEYAKHFVSGMQGDNSKYLKVSSCCKHYAVYNLENWNGNDRASFNAITSDFDLNETYLVPFKYCIMEGKASSLMCSYNAVNGVPSCANKWLLTDMARDMFGFDGYITSDCGAVTLVYTGHHYTTNPGDTIASVYQAGMDMECSNFIIQNAAAALESGQLALEDMQASLYRAALVQFRLGLFDPTTDVPWNNLTSLDVTTAANEKLSLEAAQQSIVLLKNDDSFLPLDASSVGSIALIGPLGDDETVMKGNYYGNPPFIFSVKEGLESYVHSSNITYELGCEVEGTSTDGFSAALAAAQQADLTILAIGINQTIEAEGRDRYAISLPGVQQQLIEKVTAQNADDGKATIVVVLSGGCVDMSEFVSDTSVNAMVWGGYGGMYGGQAIADVIFGAVNPVGRVTQTWYKADYINQVSMADMGIRPNGTSNPGRGYRYYGGDLVNFPFGYGLSYTKFSCSDIDTDSVNTNGQFSITVTNSGDVASSGVVMIFFVPTNGGQNGIELKRLVAFDQFAMLKSSQNVTVTLDIYREFFNGDEFKENDGTYVAGGVCEES